MSLPLTTDRAPARTVPRKALLKSILGGSKNNLNEADRYASMYISGNRVGLRVSGRIFDDLHSQLPVPVKRAESSHYILVRMSAGVAASRYPAL